MIMKMAKKGREKANGEEKDMGIGWWRRRANGILHKIEAIP